MFMFMLIACFFPSLSLIKSLNRILRRQRNRSIFIVCVYKKQYSKSCDHTNIKNFKGNINPKVYSHVIEQHPEPGLDLRNGYSSKIGATSNNQVFLTFLSIKSQQLIACLKHFNMYRNRVYVGFKSPVYCSEEKVQGCWNFLNKIVFVLISEGQIFLKLVGLSDCQF